MRARCRVSYRGQQEEKPVSSIAIAYLLIAPLSTCTHPKTHSKIFRNFERPFTPQTQLRSASNFAKTRFRRSPTFHFPTSKKVLRRNFSVVNIVFACFRQLFGQLGLYACEIQIPCNFLLQMDLLSPLYDAKTTKICLSPMPEPWGGYRYSRVQVLGGALRYYLTASPKYWLTEIGSCQFEIIVYF